jgi:hypothetical protein
VTPRFWRRPNFWLWLILAGVVTVVWLDRMFAWYHQPPLNHLQPPAGNVVTSRGVYTYLLGEAPVTLWEWLRPALTVVGCVGLAGVAAGPGGVSRLGSAGRGLLVFSLLQVGLLCLTQPVYDRYVLVVLPFALLRVAPRRGEGRPRWWAGLAALVVTAALSMALVHDWLSWNVVRWSLGRQAVANGIPATDVEGGLEWDGWHSLRPKGVAPNPLHSSPKGLMNPFNSLAFPEMTGGYALSFSVRPNTMPITTRPYTLWLDFGGRHRILLVKQIKAAPR